MTQSSPRTGVTVTVPTPDVINLTTQTAVQREEYLLRLRALTDEQRTLRMHLEQLPERHPRRLELIDRMSANAADIEQLASDALHSSLASPTEHITIAPPSPFQQIPSQYVEFAALLMVVVLLPMSVALAIRFLKRGPRTNAVMPAEILERMNRIENVVEATALEVERIGEGQRYVTQLMNDQLLSMKELPVRAPLVEHPGGRGMQGYNTPH